MRGVISALLAGTGVLAFPDDDGPMPAEGQGTVVVPIAHGSPWAPAASARAAALLAQMSTQEKQAMTHGHGNGEWRLGNYAGVVLGNTRIGWPPLNLEDGPQGVADGVSQVLALLPHGRVHVERDGHGRLRRRHGRGAVRQGRKHHAGPGRQPRVHPTGW